MHRNGQLHNLGRWQLCTQLKMRLLVTNHAKTLYRHEATQNSRARVISSTPAFTHALGLVGGIEDVVRILRVASPSFRGQKSIRGKTRH